jgi:hypothetical protein
MQTLIQTLIKDRTWDRAGHEPLSPRFCGRSAKSLWTLLLAGTMLAGAMMLSACGGGTSGSSQNNSASLSGNWQFTVANPGDNSFLGGLQGGFLLQQNNSVTGSAVYSVSLPAQNGGNPTVCNSGTASISGTVSGGNVTLTAVAGTQTYTFTGTLSSDGSTIMGSYTSTAGTAGDGTACGTAQTGLQWSASSVPPLTGTIQGSFHSAGSAASGLSGQVFPVTGSLVQGENIGASNATITGTLSFTDSLTSQSDYPCFTSASVNGQISGTSVILQIIGTSGSTLGQIGGSSGSGVNAVTFDSTQNGHVLHSLVSPAYAVNSTACPGASLSNPGDSGNICLTLGNSTACQQPITLTPAVLTFPVQMLGSTPTTQTITLTNSDPAAATLSGLTLNFVNEGSNDFSGQSDFTGLPSFTEQDTCASSPGSNFSLGSGQSCSITVTFTPQESCPWLPYGSPTSINGAAPEWCPFAQAAKLSVTSPVSADSDTTFVMPITGTGASAIVPSVPEIDFGAEALSETSLPHSLTFTNSSGNPVQILPASSATCTSPLPRPLQESSPVSGLQVVANGNNVGNSITPDGSTIIYSCDSDPSTKLPNFQISSDTCTGTLLAPQGTCSLQVAYVPQPKTILNTGLDYFLELNTLQCSSADNVASNCEIDSGRFPVELKANPPSPLRISPSAGLDFGNQTVGQTSAQLTITLLNDPAVANPPTVNFVGKVVVKGNYSETDDCSYSLAPGGSCTLTITFTPKAVGFAPGTITLNYTPEPTGSPQVIYLRGTGQ